MHQAVDLRRIRLGPAHRRIVIDPVNDHLHLFQGGFDFFPALFTAADRVQVIAGTGANWCVCASDAECRAGLSCVRQSGARYCAADTGTGEPTLELSKRRYAPNETIVVRYANLPGNQNPSTRRILLFTTIPASATMPVPVMMIENFCPMISMPISTPATDMTTAERTRAEL